MPIAALLKPLRQRCSANTGQPTLLCRHCSANSWRRRI